MGAVMHMKNYNININFTIAMQLSLSKICPTSEKPPAE
jgi:hypothetical protein